MFESNFTFLFINLLFSYAPLDIAGKTGNHKATKLAGVTAGASAWNVEVPAMADPEMQVHAVGKLNR